MHKGIRVKESTEKPIRVTSSTAARLDPADIARALGAEPAGVTREGALAPPTRFAVQQELFNRLQSSGGRPALEGTTRRAKIPLSDQEWQQLEALAASVSATGFAPSAGQVASVLLTAALKQLAAQGLDGQPDSALTRELATRTAGAATETATE